MLVASVLALAVSACQQEPVARKPNVVVILIDTLRPDHLGFYGYERETAPFLARLAKRSFVFRNAFSTTSWTAPATASLFTSLYPTQHGVTNGWFAHANAELETESKITLNRITSDVRTLPELFHDAHYATFGLAGNINIGPELGFDRGFEVFDHHHAAQANELYAELLEWEPKLREKQPYFLYLHLMDPHAPYYQHMPWFEEQPTELGHRRAAYDSEITYADYMLARAYEHFGWDTGTILVVLSDHGEEFLDHGAWQHSFRLYRELTRILLIVRPADGPAVGRTVDENVSIVDVLPTLLELVGAKPPDGREGRSLVPLLRARDGVPPTLRSRMLFGHRVRPVGTDQLWSTIHDEWQLIEGPHGPELYDFRADPGEKRNRAGDRPDVVTTLHAQLEGFHARDGGHRSERGTVPIDHKTLEQLKALGYVD